MNPERQQPLIETLENGIGGALRPWQTRRVEGANAEVRIKERLVLAQAEQDIADIKSGRKQISPDGKLISNNTQPPLLLGHADRSDTQSALSQPEISNRFVTAAKNTNDAQVLQQSVNLKKIALFAEEEAERIDAERGDPHPTDDPTKEVDEDWLTKWRMGAQDVKREKMQRLWANLLAGEVAQPGAYSLHTVDFLSRMSAADAELFAKVAPFQLGNSIFKLGYDFFSSQGLSFGEFLYLNEIGLIAVVTGIGGVQFDLTPRQYGNRWVTDLTCNNNALLLDLGPKEKPAKKIGFEVYPITKVGLEILSLATFEANEAYLQAIADLAVKKGALKVEKGTLSLDGKSLFGLHVIAEKADPK